MKLVSGDYALIFDQGGMEVQKEGKLLYYNRRPMFVTVKTAFAISEFYDQAYSHITTAGNHILAEGILTVPSGSSFSFADRYETAGDGFKVSRSVKVLKAGDELGVPSKVSFVMAESDVTRGDNWFAKGVGAKQNEAAPDDARGTDRDWECRRRLE